MMKNLPAGLGALALSCLAAAALAQTAPADAPAGTTGACKDGSYTSAASKKGACAGHKGVKDWYAASAATPAAPAATTPAPSAPAASNPATPAAKPAAAPAAAPAAPAASAATAASAKKSEGPAAAAAPGGGPGLVWVNTGSKVYHCQGDKWYGKTKAGEYMSEADAKAKGNRPDHGKACS